MINPNRLKAQRELLSLSIEEFAARAGLEPQRYRQIEAGQQPVTHTELEQIAQIVTCTTSYLLGLTDVPDRAFLEADLSEGARAFLMALHDPYKRAQLEKVIQADLQAKRLLDELAANSLFHRLIKPVRQLLVFPALLTPNLLTLVLTAIYGILIAGLGMAILLALHLSLASTLLVGGGLLLLSGVIAVKAAQETCWLVIPANLRGKLPKA